MNKEFIFALISTGIYLFGAIPFWKDVLSGRTIPHAFSMGVWLILTGFNCFVLLNNHELYGLIPSGLMTLSVLLGLVFGIKNFGKVRINWFDYLCIALSILLIVYWIISRNILNTVILTTIIDFIAFLPTFKKGWLQPWTETILIYFMSAIGQVFTLLSLSLSGFQNLENAIFWGYIFFANLIFFFMVAVRRYYLKGWKSIFE